LDRRNFLGAGAEVGCPRSVSVVGPMPWRSERANTDSLKSQAPLPAGCFPPASPKAIPSNLTVLMADNLVKYLVYLERAKEFEPSTPTLAGKTKTLL
jgi:hypothetical protein